MLITQWLQKFAHMKLLTMTECWLDFTHHLVKAMQMESEGYRILKLNTGNPAPFGFNAPEEVVRDMILNLNNAQGYSDSKGIFAARKAVMQYSQEKGIRGVDIDDIWIGNGVSELITLSLQALLNNGDELLIPAPDYPLWTASTYLAGGKAVHVGGNIKEQPVNPVLIGDVQIFKEQHERSGALGDALPMQGW
jgi:aspartate/methionine/tyrosine aminotransferase